MLSSLQIRNYILIDSLDISFPEGLVIITGQTGAGKSILLGALSLLLGAKADASVVGAASDRCVVEGVFRIPEEDTVLRELLDRNEIETEDGCLVLRRIVSRTVRSRAFAGDAPVSLPVLQELSSHLVDIHAQHQTLMLSDHGFQRSLLDHFAGDGTLLSACSDAWRKMTALQEERNAVRAELERLSRDRDYNEARFQALDAAHLREGEWEELEEEHRVLSNAEEIKRNLTAVEQLFGVSDIDDGRLPVSSVMKESGKLLDKVAGFVPAAGPLSERLASVRLELDDILDEVSSLNAGTALSADRLAEVEERISFLYGLMKKYDAADVSELIARRDALSDLLFDSTSLEERLRDLEKRLEAAQQTFQDACSALRDARERACGPFSAEVSALLHSLELPHAAFAVDLSDTAPGPSGADAVRFLFSASGAEPQDLSRCASGGELSRLMLCLKALMARFTNMPTLIFDEIDTGVSGSAADKMGRMICRMGEHMQVFAITHLPQVASQGDAHYLVEKQSVGAGVPEVTTLRRIEGEDRIREIARMLSGSDVTPAAVQNARSLLGQSAETIRRSGV